MNEPLQRLHALGQSIWYDNIRRALLDSGRLRQLVEEFAVTGVTSNPSIFERAISGSSDYDVGLREALAAGITDAEELFWTLAVADIRDAADVLRDVYDDSAGADGFVSLELPPRLSRDAGGSVEFGAELFARLHRSNVMIKVPGTAEGVAAIEELIYRGVNVNVTLLFSLSQWQAVSDSYMRGLERRAAEGLDLRVASVASYFISRIDGKANDRLPDALDNRLGVASAQLAYAASSPLAISTAACSTGIPRKRSSVSTISSARRRCWTCSCSASRTCCSSQPGTATTSPACRSRWRNISA